MMLNPYRFSASGGLVPSSAGLHFEGADLSTTFTDITGKAWAPVGNAKISTAWSAIGAASGLFDGSGDALTTANHADFRFAAGQFTVSCFLYFPSTPGNFGVVTEWGTGPGDASWALFRESGALIFRFFDGSLYRDASVAWSPAAGTKYHVAVDRDAAGTIRLYVDGVELASFSLPHIIVSGGTTPVAIGRITGFAGYDLNAYIDELVISKGVAWYAGPFAVPTTPFPDA